MLTDHHNLQGFIKDKPLRGRLGRWWETLSGYDLDIVYWTGKTNSADGLSRRPDYKVAAEAKDRWKEAERQAGYDGDLAQAAQAEDRRKGALEGTESDEDCEEVVRICSAQLLEPWEQRLAATVRRRLPTAFHGSPSNAYRLFATVI